MTPLRRTIRRKPPVVVRLRRLKLRAVAKAAPRRRRATVPQDLSSLILYGQA